MNIINIWILLEPLTYEADHEILNALVIFINRTQAEIIDT